MLWHAKSKQSRIEVRLTKGIGTSAEPQIFMTAEPYLLFAQVSEATNSPWNAFNELECSPFVILSLTNLQFGRPPLLLFCEKNCARKELLRQSSQTPGKE